MEPSASSAANLASGLAFPAFSGVLLLIDIVTELLRDDSREFANTGHSRA